jgi:hypothetical protein
MRKLSVVFASAFLMLTGSVMANGLEENDSKPSPICKQIAELLSDNNFSEANEDLTAQVRFTLNNKGEIVVLSVSTESEVLEGFVKSRLNYQKVGASGIKEGKLYTVPVRIAV